MKRIFFALTLLALVWSAIPRASGAELSVELFYNNLSGGSWIEVGDYGYGWQPDVAASDSDWRPYTDGYWAYTDYGWTWVSYEDFGWACYHYGRWARLADYGWVWFPGNDLEWGPAWVSWRVGDDHIGWAPLPPRGPGIVYEGRPIGGRVDVEFDIGPAYYNFIDIRFIGEPVMRGHIYAPTYNVTYVNQTVNVTNITVKNKIVYNYGPDYNALAAHSSRPIQKLKIERETKVNFSAAGKSGGLKNRVQGDKLVLAAPPMIRKATKEMAPPAVKTRVAKDKVKLERGWGVVGDEKAQSALKQKMKTEDLKKSPQIGGPPSVPEPMNPPGASAMTPHAGEHKGEEGKPVPSGSTPSIAAPTETAQATPFTGKPKGHLERNPGPSPSASTGTSERTNLNSSKSNAYKGPTSESGATSSEPPKIRGKEKALQPNPSGEMNSGLERQGGKKAKQLESGVTSPSGATSSGGQGGGARHEGKKKAEKESPTPKPQ